jgi:hypothetical protein
VIPVTRPTHWGRHRLKSFWPPTRFLMVKQFSCREGVTLKKYPESCHHNLHCLVYI